MKGVFPLIYETILGDDFKRLHPKLQERHGQMKPYSASGVMTSVKVGPRILKPFYHFFTLTHFLFPEEGENVPFTLATKPRMKNDQIVEAYWERTFFFPNKTRKFITNMKVDLKNKSAKDYMGQPAFINTSLKWAVSKDGELIIRSEAMHLVIGPFEFKLPKMMAGTGTIIEGYDEDKQVYTVHASIYNGLFGRMMLYAGDFTLIDS